METVLERDYPKYEIRKVIDSREYVLFIKDVGRYYSIGFYTIKSAYEYAENLIKEGRL